MRSKPGYFEVVIVVVFIICSYGYYWGSSDTFNVIVVVLNVVFSCGQ